MWQQLITYISVSSIFEVLRFPVELMIGSVFLLEIYAKRRHNFGRRIAFWMTIQIGIAFLFYPLRYLIDVNLAASTIVLPLFFLITLLSAISIHEYYEISASDTLFIFIASYAIQHIVLVFTIELVIILSPVWSEENQLIWISLGIFAYALVYTLAYRILKMQLRYKTGTIFTDHPWTVTGFTSAAVLFVSFTFLQQYLANLSFELSAHGVMIVLTDVFACVLALIIEYAFMALTRITEEKRIIEQLFQESKKQYRTSLENTEIINQKIHNIKHTINAMRLADFTEQRDFLDELDQSVMIYDAVLRTENEVLNTILTERSFYCEKHHIRLSCIIDSGSLDFMNTFDVYSLFGNALDNAITAVEKYSKIELRVISVKIHRHRNFLNINISNYLDHPLKFEDGLPVTTKNERDHHGFGVKSIQNIARKYDGIMTIDTSSNMFSLMVLIPFPDPEN